MVLVREDQDVAGDGKHYWEPVLILQDHCGVVRERRSDQWLRSHRFEPVGACVMDFCDRSDQRIKSSSDWSRADSSSGSSSIAVVVLVLLNNNIHLLRYAVTVRVSITSA